MSERFNLTAIIEELEEQKKLVMLATESAKNGFIDTMEDSEETIEDIDEDEVKMKAIVAKLKIMEELEEIQQLLSNLGSKTKEVVDASQDEIQESWDAAKKVMDTAENKVADIFKK